jgi:hypothetical protein
MSNEIQYSEKQQKIIDEINNLSHYQLCHAWRFYKSGHTYFTQPYFEVFRKRLFDDLGGFTPEISKSLYN